MAQHLRIFGSLPDADLFRFAPPAPAAFPPAPAPAASAMHPFNIPPALFSAALHPAVPLAIAAAYAVAVKALNRYNRARAKKPWAISKTRPFSVFVVAHNIFLAVYSAWTFWGMLGGMRRSIRSPFGPDGVAGTADSFCRLQGPAGLGNSIYFDDESQGWRSAGAPAAMPSALEPGRMWNEGLAYYGWIFYLSKFYEVLDTFIILAKGKPSSTLQTYHHTGAMICMWAGMRYMSVPIWVFVVVNSFIHAMMYTYYTLTAFSVKVPLAAKRTLTSLQITQFLLGASYTMLHSFVSYVVPVPAARSTSSSSIRAAAPTDSASGALGSLRQLVFGSSRAEAAVVHEVQPCIVSTGETFAIWLNILYLAPLTYLFVSFFVASYLKRSNAAHKAGGDPGAVAEKAGWDAARGVEREVYGGEGMVSGNGQASSSAVASEGVHKKKSGKAKRRA